MGLKYHSLVFKEPDWQQCTSHFAERKIWKKENYLKNCGMDINISLLNYYNTDLISPPFRLGAKSKAKFDLIFYNIIRKLILLHCWYCQVISLVLNYFREVLNKWSHVCIFVVDFICPLISCLILLFRYVLEATVTLVTGKIHVICFS